MGRWLGLGYSRLGWMGSSKARFGLAIVRLGLGGLNQAGMG